MAHARTLEPPPEIESAAITDSSLEFAWTATEADRGRATYTVSYCVSGDGMICDPGTVGATTKSLVATITGLAPATDFYVQVSARDSGRNSVVGEVYGPYTTCASGESCGSGGGDDGGGGDGGGGDGGSCDYPAFSSPPGSVTSYDFVKPNWVVAESPVFDEGFGGTGENSESWIVESMHDPLNRSGNAGIDEDGGYCSNCSPDGKRFSAWYDERWNATIGGIDSALVEPPLPPGGQADPNAVYRVEGIGDGSLLLGGTVSNEPDPTRPGAGSPWEDHRFHTSWIKTWARDPNDFDQASSQNVEGRDKWTAPMYLETRVNFSRMRTPGFRLSMWLMPATYLDGTLATNAEAYDGDFKNGFELDVFEFEPWTPECKDLLEFSWINSFASKGRQGRNASRKAHLKRADVGEGWHTLGFLWEADRMLWVYDGEVVLEVTDASRIPEIHQYLIVSREMTNGLLGGSSSYDDNGYFLPPEGGLYGFAGGSNVGSYVDDIGADEAEIDYIRIYTP